MIYICFIYLSIYAIYVLCKLLRNVVYVWLDMMSYIINTSIFCTSHISTPDPCLLYLTVHLHNEYRGKNKINLPSLYFKINFLNKVLRREPTASWNRLFQPHWCQSLGALMAPQSECDNYYLPCTVCNIYELWVFSRAGPSGSNQLSNLCIGSNRQPSFSTIIREFLSNFTIVLTKN